MLFNLGPKFFEGIRKVVAIGRAGYTAICVLDVMEMIHMKHLALFEVIIFVGTKDIFILQCLQQGCLP